MSRNDAVATTATLILFAVVLAVSITLIVASNLTFLQGSPGDNGRAGSTGEDG